MAKKKKMRRPIRNKWESKMKATRLSNFKGRRKVAS
jgi:hypothetical protein